ncbi:MAG: hypothetical protein M3198_10200, partial [Actinomycetota bacterium]|nr:hypothetical protein [Actinomycetota bacterium]
MSNGTVKVFVPIEDVYPDLPAGIFDTVPDERGRSLLDSVSVTGFSVEDADNELILRTDLEILGEAVLGMPGVEAVKLALGDSKQPTVPFRSEIILSDRPKLRVLDLEPRLRFSENFLKPVTRSGSAGPFVPDLTRKAEIPLGAYNLEISSEGGISLSPRAGVATSFTLDPVALGDTGLVLEASGISISLDPANPPLGKPAGWQGCLLGNATIYLPDSIATDGGQPVSISFTNASIGPDGVSGTATATWKANYDPTSRTITGDLVGKLGGFTFALESAEISLLNNALIEVSIQGLIRLPYFDQVLRVDVGLSAGGSLTLNISSSQPPGATENNGIIKFRKEGLLEASVDSLALMIGSEGSQITISGNFRPLVADLDWPNFDVKVLSIDSTGGAKFKGGWLDLPEAKSLNFHGFKLELTKLGFGTDETTGENWIGFNGGVHLAQGMPAGASVEGLRILWDPKQDPLTHPPRVQLAGVGVSLDVPGSFSFAGKVAFFEDKDRGTKGFRGDIKLQLQP